MDDGGGGVSLRKRRCRDEPRAELQRRGGECARGGEGGGPTATDSLDRKDLS